MLTFSIIGPDTAGHYSIVYATPGNLQRTLHTGGLSAVSAINECERLNEEQVFDKRQTLAERANRIVDDLPAKPGSKA